MGSSEVSCHVNAEGISNMLMRMLETFSLRMSKVC
jgi:hypothetical protein